MEEKKTISLTMQAFARAKFQIDICSDRTGAPVFVNVEPINTGHATMKNKGIQLRFLTDISQDNVQYVKKLMKTAEICHLDDIKGNFGLVDGDWYYASAQSDEQKGITRQIFANVKEFVEQQQLFFNTLWKKAIPATQRIKEIEEHLREFMETIQDPSETLGLIHETISSATEEIMIMFPTIRSFQVYETEGILNIIKKRLENRITVRLLLSRKDRPPQEAWQEISSFPNLQIQYTDQLPSSRLTMIIVDNELSLVVEEKKYEDPVGIATYSNSESTVLSYASIFENLWIQSEIKQR
jgi:hypothetical protein